MKKAFSYFIILSMLMMTLVVPTEVFHAYEANLSVGVSSSNIKIGDTVTVTVKVPGAVSGPVSLYFPTDVMEYVSTSTEASVVGGTIQFSIGKGGRAASDTVTVNLKAKTTGTANLKVEATGDIYDYDSLEEVVLKGTSTTVTVENQVAGTGNEGEGEGGGESETPPETPKSGDNSLSSLKLSSGTLSPSFKYNVTKYTATVEYDVTKVVVSAKTSNEKATIESVTGDGNVNLEVGENTIKIVVKAENGVKATYTIVVTRKEKETTVTPPPSEGESDSNSESESNTDSESETTTPQVNEVLQYNGEQLSVTENIPEGSIPADFESALLVVNGQQMQGLSFKKGDLKVLYLNNTNGAGSLYVYDDAQNSIYPFIKLTAERSYVMVLVPDEQNAPVPEGFESCIFSLEGKGLINAYQMKEEVVTDDATMSWNLFGPETFYAAPAKASELYLIYCMNNTGEKGWYMYDTVEGTFQRYLELAPSVEVEGDVSSEEENSEVHDVQSIQNKYIALQKELSAAKMTQYIIVAIAAAVVLILVVVIIVLILKNRNKDEDFFEEYEDEEEDEEEYDDIKAYAAIQKVEDVEETENVEVIENTEVVEEINVVEIVEDVETDVKKDIKDVEEIESEGSTEAIEEDEDEIEIEFYEMEPEDEQEEEEVEIEFYNMEELIVNEVEETEIKIERRPRVEDPTSKLLSKKEDDDDLEFIDFE